MDKGENEALFGGNVPVEQEKHPCPYDTTLTECIGAAKHIPCGSDTGAMYSIEGRDSSYESLANFLKTLGYRSNIFYSVGVVENEKITPNYERRLDAINTDDDVKDDIKELLKTLQKKHVKIYNDGYLIVCIDGKISCMGNASFHYGKNIRVKDGPLLDILLHGNWSVNTSNQKVANNITKAQEKMKIDWRDIGKPQRVNIDRGVEDGEDRRDTSLV